jgi:hypothetical protein
VAQANDEDDTVWRWVIYHYRFDPALRQRRNVVVAAYDNESQFRAELDRHAELIRSEIAAGTRRARENISGVALEPGHLATAARGHDVRRAIEHGVSPELLLTAGPLPHNMAVLSFTDDDTPPVTGVD